MFVEVSIRLEVAGMVGTLSKDQQQEVAQKVVDNMEYNFEHELIVDQSIMDWDIIG